MIKNKTFIHLTNIPTPYRINFFNELNNFLKCKDLELIVIYCAKSEPNRNWSFDESKIKYKFKIIKGITVNIRDFYIHINPFILISLINLKPDLLLTAGSWNMPSAIISLLPFCKKNCPKIFWSEGHKKSVRNPKGFIAFLRRKIIRLYDF